MSLCRPRLYADRALVLLPHGPISVPLTAYPVVTESENEVTDA